jgi:nitrite reductase (NO-forming)
VNGLQVGVPMPHSMDFHASIGSPQEWFHTIKPGETIRFEYVANFPGVFMYHCGTQPILEHIASGMYGATVIEPREGYADKADASYVIVQSDFYLKPGGGKDGLYVYDAEAARLKHASHVVFNGSTTSMKANPLKVKKGDRVRLYVLNAGPTGTSSFHVVGTSIFDHSYLDGNPCNPLRGMQTVLLGASNSVVADFIVPAKALYPFVDHEFTDAMAGAIGLLDSTDAKAAVAGPALTDAQAGEAVVKAKCAVCHVPPAGAMRIAPDLAGATKRHDAAWLDAWLADPPRMLAEDAAAKKLLAEWKGVAMPQLNLTTDEIRQVKAYLGALDAPKDAAPAGGGHEHHME